MSRLAASLTLACVAVTSPLVAQNQVPAQPPQFRAGVEIMRIEATVLDKRTRRPIRGLTAQDFVVKVNGQQQEVVALTEIEVPGPDAGPAAWVRESPADVVTNRPFAPAGEGRLVVIVMDDALTMGHQMGRGTDPYHRNIGIQTGHRIIDQLGPQDKAAVIFPQFNQHAQDFTTDRTLLRRAVDTYNPQELHPWLAAKMSLGSLKRLGQFLASIPEHRRAIFWVTTGPRGAGSEDPLNWSGEVMQQTDVSMREDEIALLSDIRGAMAASRIAHVPVYPVSTLGLEAPTPGEIRYGGPARSRANNEALMAIARASGGRAVINNNKPDQFVDGLFEELSTFYVLAYETSYPMDGKLRRLNVSVNRKDAEVVPGGMVFTTPLPPGASKRRAPVRASTLLEAVASPLSGGSLPLQVTVAPFLAPDRQREPRAVAALTLGITVPEPIAQGQTELVNLETRVFDGEGRKEIILTHRTVSLHPSSDSSLLYEVVLPLDLAPGRYNVRVGADAPGLTLSGGVFMTMVVPGFTKDAVSMSGVAIGRAHTRVAGGMGALADLLPFAPTSVRAFSHTDIVGAMVRVYQPASRASAIRIDTTIADASGRVVATDAAQQAAPGEHRYELPLKILGPGDYLLTFTATAAGGVVAKREVRFTVR